jgi:hypothetical protein
MFLVALYVDPTDGIIIELIVLHTARRDTMQSRTQMVFEAQEKEFLEGQNAR